MEAFWGIIVPVAPVGIPAIVVGVVAVLVGLFVLMPSVRKSEKTTEFEDPDDDPIVIRKAKFLRLAMWGGFAVSILGAVLTSSPQWATIIV